MNQMKASPSVESCEVLNRLPSISQDALEGYFVSVHSCPPENEKLPGRQFSVGHLLLCREDWAVINFRKVGEFFLRAAKANPIC